MEKIIEWSGCKKLELLYREIKDGSNSKILHNKSNNKGPTICLYKNEKWNIFGGYASIWWTSDGKSHSASESFIFTLTNIYGIQPSKFANSDINNSVFHWNDFGPTFYNDICIYKDFLNENDSVFSNFPNYYEDTTGKKYSIFTGNNNSKKYFKVKEIEVFRAYK